MLNWHNPQAYQFTNNLNAEQWAWEFLRRNPQYRKEWREFSDTWKALEASYGKPGQRNIAAWKQDPRAWVPAAECTESDCRVDDEKVLIECAMGARWGFYKFPPDSADDDPVGGGRLNWRDFPVEPALVHLEQVHSDVAPGSVMLSFDLSLPLRDQLTSAKRQLQIEQRNRVRAGVIRAPSIAAHREQLCRLLRLLDALEAEVKPEQIQSNLYAQTSAHYLEDRDEAILLRDLQYRRLLLLE
ncbi:MAG: DUF6499 domain-containing protein [Pseudomonadota bacterium]